MSQQQYLLGAYLNVNGVGYLVSYSCLFGFWIFTHWWHIFNIDKFIDTKILQLYQDGKLLLIGRKLMKKVCSNKNQ